MSRLEKDFVKKILLPRLKALPNSWVFVPPTLQIRGIPDILMCLEGRFVALECKRAKAAKDNSRETLQRYVCAQIRNAGGVAFERVDEGNFENVIRFLRGKSRESGEQL